MAPKPSSSAAPPPPQCASPSLKVSKEMDPRHTSQTLYFVSVMGADTPVPDECNTRGFYSTFLRSFITVDHIQRGRISCTIVAKPPLCVTTQRPFFLCFLCLFLILRFYLFWIMLCFVMLLIFMFLFFFFWVCSWENWEVRCHTFCL